MKLWYFLSFPLYESYRHLKRFWCFAVLKIRPIFHRLPALGSGSLQKRPGSGSWERSNFINFFYYLRLPSSCSRLLGAVFKGFYRLRLCLRLSIFISLAPAPSIFFTGSGFLLKDLAPGSSYPTLLFRIEGQNQHCVLRRNPEISKSISQFCLQAGHSYGWKQPLKL